MLIRSTGNAQIDAFVEFEVRYNQTRWAEVWLAMAMTLTCVVFLDAADTFSLSKGYDFLAQFITEKQAGIIGVFVGIARMFALWVNGSKKRSPLWRVVGCVGGTLFWGALCWGFWVQTLPGNALSGFVPVLFTLCVAELHSSGRASRDAYAYARFKEAGVPDANAFLTSRFA